uniref:Uncharacterized protein n=1 Tax=Arundo donax TaxID=35708 RepID=A0A0A9F206_ARUDO
MPMYGMKYDDKKKEDQRLVIARRQLEMARTVGAVTSLIGMYYFETYLNKSERIPPLLPGYV